MLRLLATGAVTAAGGALLAACGGTAPTTMPGSAPAQTSARPLTRTFYQWIVDLHTSILQVNSSFEGLNFQIAPVQVLASNALLPGRRTRKALGMAWNINLTDKAGITSTPTTWDEYLENAKQAVDSGAALYGTTYDARKWWSLAPFTHRLSTNVYVPDNGRIRASLRCM